MKAVITYYNPEDRTEIIGGIYNGIRYADLVAEVGKHNVIDYIPLTVSGIGYKARKADLEGKAIEWSYACSLNEWSYGELAEINNFFEVNGKRYGLIREFRENAIC